MEYIENFETVDGEDTPINFMRDNADGTTSSIPPAIGNLDYDKMVEEVAAGASTIVRVDQTIPSVPQWSQDRQTDIENGGYGTVKEQLEILGEQGIGAYQQHIAAVKAANEKS